MARGRLANGALENVGVIFRQQPKVGGSNHFGSRLVFAPDGTLFVTLGERFKFDPAQDNTNHLGTIVRINPDGSVPPDNPFVGRPDARPEIWSYGHRNVQGAAIQPGTGTFWALEFGPLGGDELNRPEPGRNYGWPLVSWGKHYDGTDIPDPPTRPDLEDAVYHWVPAISPSGMSFYDGALFPAWRGDLLIGGLSSRALVRLSLENGRVTGEERIPMGARVRHARPGPDGAVYLLIDSSDGEILTLRRLTGSSRDFLIGGGDDNFHLEVRACRVWLRRRRRPARGRREPRRPKPRSSSPDISPQGVRAPKDLRKSFWQNALPDSRTGSDANTVYLRSTRFRSV